MQEPRFDLLVSRVIRLAGVVIAMHEEFFIKGDRSAGFAVAAVMMSGSLAWDAFVKRSKNGEK